MNDDSNTNSNTFTITPMGKDIQLKAGEKVTGTITVINQQDSKDPFSFKVSVAPYGVVGEGYDADLVTATEQTRLAKWVTIDTPSGTVAPNESKEVTYTINVPENAPAGGQYAAIVISSNNPSESPTTVDYVYEMASILYGEVEGETVHGGSVVSHSVPGFSTTPKISTTAQIENNGNVHEYARINLTVTNFFSGEEIANTEEQETQVAEVIMPSTTRHFINSLNNLPSLGVVTVKETINYLGEDSVIEQRIVICPLWFLLLVAFTLVSIIAAVVLRVRRRRYMHPKKDKSEMSL